jgi:hypothetical protein
MKKFDKHNRPEASPRGRISERDLHLIETVLRYRFSASSELLRLVGGNYKVTLRRLTFLWRAGLLNRFAFADPRRMSHSEFHYYIDRKESLDLLLEHGLLDEVHPQMEAEVRQNREAQYGEAWLDASSGKSLFLRHQLMVSRMRYMLEMGCWSSDGRIDLFLFRPDLAAYRITAPQIAAKRQADGRYEWAELDREEKLPIKPDAIFSLHVRSGHSPAPATEAQSLHFAYEADRGTMPLGDMLKKLRAYYYLIKRYKRHQEAFGLHPIRAVLIEAPDEKRVLKLMDLATHPLVCGPARRTGLFWFVPSFLFTTAADTASPPYLTQPEMIFDRHWGLPEGPNASGQMQVSKHSLLDGENSPK